MWMASWLTVMTTRSIFNILNDHSWPYKHVVIFWMKGTMNPACLSPLWHPWHPLWWMVLASKLLGIIINIIIMIIIIIINVLIIFIILVFVANHSNSLWLASWQHLWNENVLLLGRNASSLRWMVLASMLLGIIITIIIFIIRIYEYLPLNNIAYWVFH